MPLRPYREYLDMLPPGLTRTERQAVACLLRAEWLLIKDIESVKLETLERLEEAASRLIVWSSDEGGRCLDLVQAIKRYMWDDDYVAFMNERYDKE